MPTNDERREVATRLRDYEGLREAFIESPLCAFLDALGVEGYIDWNGVINILADLIEPGQERTCKPETEVLDTVDIGIGLLERLVDNCSDCGEPLTCDYSSNAPWRRVLPNYCPNCGAKIISGKDADVITSEKVMK